MKTNVIMKKFEIHTTPLESIIVRDRVIEIELDDIHEKRYRIVFKPYQALKIVTIDCVSYKEYLNDYSFRNGIYHRFILLVEDSCWIKELKRNLTDKRATFLDDAKHYVLPLQDNIIEIVANNLTLEECY